MVRDYYARVAELSGDAGLASEVAAISPRVLELSELLVDRLGVEDVGAYFPRRVTYHPTCHSLRMLHVGDRPLRLLRAVRGHRRRRAARGRAVLRLRRHVRGQERRHLDRDAVGQGAQILDTGAEVCVSADNSCLMHIGGALSRQRTGVRTMHLAEILAQTKTGASV